MFKVIQVNVNKSRPALDLLMQQAMEAKAGVLIISEINSVPDAPNWFSSIDCNAAIFVNNSFMRLRCTLPHQETRYVAINCGSYFIVSVYIYIS